MIFLMLDRNIYKQFYATISIKNNKQTRVQG